MTDKYVIKNDTVLIVSVDGDVIGEYEWVQVINACLGPNPGVSETEAVMELDGLLEATGEARWGNGKTALHLKLKEV